MNNKDKLLQVIDQSSEFFIEELLNFALSLSEQYDSEELTEAEKKMVMEAEQAYQAGDYITLEEYEVARI
jgi:hypothetical protein